MKSEHVSENLLIFCLKKIIFLLIIRIDFEVSFHLKISLFDFFRVLPIEMELKLRKPMSGKNGNAPNLTRGKDAMGSPSIQFLRHINRPLTLSPPQRRGTPSTMCVMCG